jgi:hypothetical protein
MKLTLERVAAVLREQGLGEHVGPVLDALTRRPKQTPGAARQARYRERQSVTKSVTVTPSRDAPLQKQSVTKGVTVTPKVTPLARVEDNPSTIELSGKGKNNLGAERHAVTPRQILLECLSPECADAVLEHRRAMRRPLTGRAAQLLAKGFLATADPNAAADMMIERGWQGFRPEWFDNERRSNGQPQQQSGKKRSISDVAPGFIERIDKLYADRGSRPSDGGAAGGEAVRLLSSQRRE